MQRARQVSFIVCALALSWLGMMAVHELGHVVGAWSSGGAVERVVLHPLSISRTDVSPNPHPAVVVWCGPILGCVLPAAVATLWPTRRVVAWSLASWFAGFCFIANGAYIGLGSFDGIGDCGEMLRTGTPIWLLWSFGTLMCGCGLFCWHRLGSPRAFLSTPEAVTPRMAIIALGATALLAALAMSVSTR